MNDDCGVKPNPALTERGWVRRYLADATRAREAVETYAEAGFEVHLESLQPEDFARACQECAVTACTAFKVVYTRTTGKEEP